MFDLVHNFAMPVSGAALVAITCLRQMRPVNMDQVSQAMIDGCSNYIGKPSVTQAGRAAIINIDAHIAQMIPELTEKPDNSIFNFDRGCPFHDEYSIKHQTSNFWRTERTQKRYC